MRKKFFFAFILFSIFISAFSQKNQFYISGSVQIPMGDFWSTHIAGMNAEFSSMVQPKDSTKKFRFVYKAGISYFLGKNKETNGFEYKYPNYLIAEAGVGVLFNVSGKIFLELEAGPGVGFYNNSTRFLLLGDLNGFYTFKKFSAGPLIKIIKETGANALWVSGIRLRFKI